MRNQRAGRAEKHDAQTGVTQGAMAAAVNFFGLQRQGLLELCVSTWG